MSPTLLNEESIRTVTRPTASAPPAAPRRAESARVEAIDSQSSSRPSRAGTGPFRILMLDGDSHLALSVARCLGRDSQIHLHVVSASRLTPLRFSRHVRAFHIEPAADCPAQRVAGLLRLAARIKADLVLGIEEPTIRFLAAHRDLIEPSLAIAPAPSTASFDIAVNKWQLSQFMAEHGIPHPRTLLHTADDDFRDRLERFAFPVLMKPVDGKEGRNIHRFNSAHELHRYTHEQKVESGAFLVQSFVRGCDIDCSVLCDRGRIVAHTIQRGILPSKCTYGPPSGIEFLHDDRVLEVVRDLMNRLQWSGVAHLDLRFDEADQQVKVLEINARYWASLPGSLAAGVNFALLSCLLGAGRPVPASPQQPCRYVALTASLKNGFHKILGRDVPTFALSETGLAMLLSDPMPEAFLQARRLMRSIRANGTSQRR